MNTGRWHATDKLNRQPVAIGSRSSIPTSRLPAVSRQTPPMSARVNEKMGQRGGLTSTRKGIEWLHRGILSAPKTPITNGAGGGGGEEHSRFLRAIDHPSGRGRERQSVASAFGECFCQVTGNSLRLRDSFISIENRNNPLGCITPDVSYELSLPSFPSFLPAFLPSFLLICSIQLP